MRPGAGARRGRSAQPGACRRCMAAHSASAARRFVTHIDDGAIAALTRCAEGLALAVLMSGTLP
jgi:hypothetical protein